MPIEKNIAHLKKISTKTNKTLKSISDWQIKHEVEDSRRFQDIQDSIAKLPTQEVITAAIATSIKTVVNGKIDTLNGKVDMVGEHLKRQDSAQEEQATAIQDLSRKIRPLDSFKSYLVETARIIMYVGGLSIAVAGIIALLKLMKVLN